MASLSSLHPLLSPGHPFSTLQPEWTFQKHTLHYVILYVYSTVLPLTRRTFWKKTHTPYHCLQDLVWAGFSLCVNSSPTSLITSNHPHLAVPWTHLACSHLKSFGFVVPFALNDLPPPVPQIPFTEFCLASRSQLICQHFRDASLTTQQ